MLFILFHAYVRVIERFTLSKCLHIEFLLIVTVMISIFWAVRRLVTNFLIKVPILGRRLTGWLFAFFCQWISYFFTAFHNFLSHDDINTTHLPSANFASFFTQFYWNDQYVNQGASKGRIFSMHYDIIKCYSHFIIPSVLDL